MRLIDADALIQAADKMFENIDSPLLNHLTTYDVYSLINNAPTVDTTFREVVAYECGQKSEERPTGEWIFIDNDIGWDKCSNCDWTDARCHSWNFCPSCGAKMMKETDTCENTKHGTCEWYTSDIRWTDKLSVIANGDIIDFYGRVVGHMNSKIMKGGAE